MDDLRAHYDEHGYVRLPAAFDEATARAMVDSTWSELTRRHGVRPDDPGTWRFDQARKLGRLTKHGAFDGVATPRFLDAVSALAGADDWPRPDTWGGPLVTLPTPGTWSVPGDGYHLDWPARGAPGSQLVVKWLGYAASVEPGGGGTVVIDGSHRLVADWLTTSTPDDPGRSSAVRAAIFGAHPWFRAFRPDAPDRDEVLGAGAVVRGIAVKVVELTGEPGDVVFLHPRLFHAASANHSDRPRFMFTGQVIRFG